jgi:regulator of protease activity HflC (stomatin/prohibitin superfamily)
MRNVIIAGVVIIVGIVLLTQSLYVVDQTEQVIITRFGEVKSVQTTSGLRAKQPFVDTVVRFDRRLLRIDAQAEAMRDIEKQDLTIDSYARYRIIDPVQFRKTLLTEDNARSRLSDIVNSTLRERIAVRTRQEIIGARQVFDQRGNPVEDVEGLPLFEGTESRTKLVGEVQDGVELRVIAQERTQELLVPDLAGQPTFSLRLTQPVLDSDNSDRDGNLGTGISASDVRITTGPDGGKAPGIDVVATGFDPATNTVTFSAQKGESLVPGDGFTIQYFVQRDEPFGIELVDVRIMRADFPDSVTPSIFTRMRAERNRIATRFRAQGDEQDLQIRATANKSREIILAEADRGGNETRGEGEAEAIRLLAEALEQDPDFFAFRRSLEAYRQVLNPGTTVILSADADLFRFLDSPGQSTATQGSK